MESGELQSGLCISSYVLSEVGLGQAARNLGLAAESAGINTTYVDIPLVGRNHAIEFAAKVSKVNDQRTTVHVLSAVNVNLHPVKRGSGRKHILYPFWELDTVPKQWLKDITHFDEIWAPSAFVASAFKVSTDLPVFHIPQAVPLLFPQQELRTADRAFVVLTYLDFDSFIQRKNLSAALNAFLTAFPFPEPRTELWVKTRGGRDEGVRDAMVQVLRQHPRVRLIDKTISREEMDGLVRSCDVLLSLHRSEGFGLGAAEALVLEKAVVATDYSGTRDFINAETAYPVSYTLVRVEEGDYVKGTEGLSWADPSVDDAAQQLRLAYADVMASRCRGKRGRQFMAERHAPQVVGKVIAERLAQLWG